LLSSSYLFFDRFASLNPSPLTPFPLFMSHTLPKSDSPQAIPAFDVQLPLSIGHRSADSRFSCPIATLNRTPLRRFLPLMSNSHSQSDTAPSIPVFDVR